MEQLKDFGVYIAECLPKYVQKVQIAAGDELEVLVCPDGIIPTLSFLKNHQNAQYVNLSDITAVDVPSRTYRFEVRFYIALNTFIFFLTDVLYLAISSSSTCSCH